MVQSDLALGFTWFNVLTDDLEEQNKLCSMAFLNESKLLADLLEEKGVYGSGWTQK